MFGNRYFAPRYFADRYYPPGSTAVVVAPASSWSGTKRVPLILPGEVRVIGRLTAPASEMVAVAQIVQPVIGVGELVARAEMHGAMATTSPIRGIARLSTTNPLAAGTMHVPKSRGFIEEEELLLIGAL